MTKDEKFLVAEILYWRKKYNDCNPDIGMGPSDEYILAEIFDNFPNIEISELEFSEILEIVKNEYI